MRVAARLAAPAGKTSAADATEEEAGRAVKWERGSAPAAAARAAAATRKQMQPPSGPAPWRPTGRTLRPMQSLPR
jgi:hypothetical protein